MKKEIRHGWWSHESFIHLLDQSNELGLLENEIREPFIVYTKKDGSYVLIWQVTTKKEMSGGWKDQVYVGEVVDYVSPRYVDKEKLATAINEVEELYYQKYGKKINLLSEACFDLDTLDTGHSQPKEESRIRFVLSHSVHAFNVDDWQKNRLQDFGSFAEKIEYVGQREVGDLASGEWYFIGKLPREDGSKVIYHGSYSDSCIAGAMTETYADIYVVSHEAGENEYEKDVMEWENRPEWAEDEESDEDWDKNDDEDDDDLGSFGHEEY